VDTQEPRKLSRWLGAGVVAGVIVIGIAVAAYAVGYSRGKHHDHRTAAPPATTSQTTTTAPASAVAVTPALVAQGKRLYGSDGCSACHSLTGGAGAGPSFKGLAGSTVTLATGQTVTADDGYLERAVADPDAQIVKGYNAGVMPAAIASYDLAAKPSDLRALVAFIKSQQ
jgi:mono/diheme cytochrome c family protein